MTLKDFGYNNRIESLKAESGITDFEIGRVIAEHKERYTVITERGESEAEITGNLRYSASGREDFPAVGDWVALTTYDSDFSVIHKILPRSSVISRQAVGRPGEIQVIAANIDYALLVQAVDRDFNINRLERYLTICHSSKVNPDARLLKQLRKANLSRASSKISVKCKGRNLSLKHLYLKERREKRFSGKS
ncbi:MAG: GTPase RsgA [Bacteroidales bacterium]